MTTHGEGSLKKVFRDNQLKATPQRLDVLKLLMTCNEHLDAEEIYQRLLKKKKNVSRATIYRTLEVLVEHDLYKNWILVMAVCGMSRTRIRMSITTIWCVRFAEKLSNFTIPK